MATPNQVAVPAGAKAKLVCIKGLRVGKTYMIKEGVNYLGKGPAQVDIALGEQDKACTAAPRHALIYLEKGVLSIADAKSPGGTYLNKAKIAPGKKFLLKGEDTIHIGQVGLQVKIALKKKTGAAK